MKCRESLATEGRDPTTGHWSTCPRRSLTSGSLGVGRTRSIILLQGRTGIVGSPRSGSLTGEGSETFTLLGETAK